MDEMYIAKDLNQHQLLIFIEWFSVHKGYVLIELGLHDDIRSIFYEYYPCDRSYIHLHTFMNRSDMGIMKPGVDAWGGRTVMAYSIYMLIAASLYLIHTLSLCNDF